MAESPRAPWYHQSMPCAPRGCAVEIAIPILIGFQNPTRQINAREETLGTRVGNDLGMQLRVGGGCSGPPDGARRDREASTVFTAEDERSLPQRRNDHDALGF